MLRKPVDTLFWHYVFLSYKWELRQQISCQREFPYLKILTKKVTQWCRETLWFQVFQLPQMYVQSNQVCTFFRLSLTIGRLSSLITYIYWYNHLDHVYLIFICNSQHNMLLNLSGPVAIVRVSGNESWQ